MKLFAYVRTWVLVPVAVLLLSNTVLLAKKQRRLSRTTAHSVVDPSYKREKLPNGEWKVETFAFGVGNMVDPSEKDESLTELTFDEMAEILAGALRQENYVPAPSSEETDLMIVVNWGRTMPHSDDYSSLGRSDMVEAANDAGSIRSGIGPADATALQQSELDSLESQINMLQTLQVMSDGDRRKANDHNARLLGYAPAFSELHDVAPIGVQRSKLNDLLAEIEVPRYFVILHAYDFQEMWENKEKRLIWIARFSIRAKGRRFDEELENMARAASSSFGNDSGKLRRSLLPGKGKIGELEVISIESEE